jgi:putative cell wall-binding protein
MTALMLLTQATRLPKATADEVRRLRVKRVVVIGGTSVVSQSVVEELDRLVV